MAKTSSKSTHRFIMLGATLVVLTMIMVLASTNMGWRLFHRAKVMLTPKSHIPQFILDTRHPWLAENPYNLQYHKDPVGLLCDLTSSIREDGIAYDCDRPRYPQDLYKYLEIDNNRYGVDRGGWNNARDRLLEILNCPAALQDVEHFKVNIYVHRSKWDTQFRDSENPPASLPPLLVQVLSLMPNLRTLEFNTYGHGVDKFKEAFQEANLRLSSVHRLVPAALTQFLVDHCPELEDIQSGQSISTADYWRMNTPLDPRLLLFNSTQKLRNLRSFGMTGEWEIEYLETLLRLHPHLKEIRINGEIEESYYGYSKSCPGKKLKEYVEVLSQFPQLESLQLPSSASLGLGFDGGPGCGNVYMGPDGRAYRRFVEGKGAKATEEAGKIVLDKLINLTSLRFGGECAKLEKLDNGKVIAIWPWTSGIKNWTMAHWPDEAKYAGIPYYQWEDDEDEEEAFVYGGHKIVQNGRIGAESLDLEALSMEQEEEEEEDEDLSDTEPASEHSYELL